MEFVVCGSPDTKSTGLKPGKLFPQGAWGLTGNPLENPIEMSDRLEANFVSNFSDPGVGVEQKVLRLLYSDAGKIVGKVQSRGLLKHFAKIKRADVGGIGD